MVTTRKLNAHINRNIHLLLGRQRFTGTDGNLSHMERNSFSLLRVLRKFSSVFVLESCESVALSNCLFVEVISVCGPSFFFIFLPSTLSPAYFITLLRSAPQQKDILVVEKGRVRRGMWQLHMRIRYSDFPRHHTFLWECVELRHNINLAYLTPEYLEVVMVRSP